MARASACLVLIALARAKADRLKPVLLKSYPAVAWKACRLAVIPAQVSRRKIPPEDEVEPRLVADGLERDVAARRVDRRRSGRAIGLRSVGCDGNELSGRRAAGRRPRASVPDKCVQDAIRIALHQIHRGRKERHVAPVRAASLIDGEILSRIGGVAAQSDGYQCAGRRAAGRRALASIADKNILSRAGNFGDAVRWKPAPTRRSDGPSSSTAMTASLPSATLLGGCSIPPRRKNRKWLRCQKFPTGRGINHSNLVRSSRRDISRGIDCRDSVGPYELVVGRRAVPLNDRAGQQIASIHRDERAVRLCLDAALEGESELIDGAGKVVPVGSAVMENVQRVGIRRRGAADTVLATAAAPVPRAAVSADVIAAASCVPLTNVVGTRRAVPVDNGVPRETCAAALQSG